MLSDVNKRYYKLDTRVLLINIVYSTYEGCLRGLSNNMSSHKRSNIEQMKIDGLMSLHSPDPVLTMQNSKSTWLSEAREMPLEKNNH